MNANIKNQESFFEKKKKIIIICLSAVLVFTTLIAGLFFAKKNKESSFEESNKDNYFFNKESGQIMISNLLLYIAGTLFFFWENNKLPEGAVADVGSTVCEKIKNNSNFCFFGKNASNNAAGAGLFEGVNWFGFGTFVSLIVITLLVELILHFLIGSISHLFSKDKSKRYFHILEMSWKKRKQFFSFFSKKKISLLVLIYLFYALEIAILARVVKKCHPCCCSCCKDEYEQVFITTKKERATDYQLKK